MDFQLHYGGTSMWEYSVKLFGEIICITGSGTSKNYSQQKSIKLEQRQERWQQNKTWIGFYGIFYGIPG